MWTVSVNHLMSSTDRDFPKQNQLLSYDWLLFFDLMKLIEFLAREDFASINMQIEIKLFSVSAHSEIWRVDVGCFVYPWRDSCRNFCFCSHIMDLSTYWFLQTFHRWDRNVTEFNLSSPMQNNLLLVLLADIYLWVNINVNELMYKKGKN